MSAKRRKWTLAISALLTAAAAVPVSAEDFNDFMGKLPPSKPQEQPASQQAGATAYILPSAPLPATQPANSDFVAPAQAPLGMQPAATAPVARVNYNLASPPDASAVPGSPDHGTACGTCAPKSTTSVSTGTAACPSGATTQRESRREARHETCQDHFLGYPAELMSPPLGHSVYETNEAMVSNGDAARMALYHYDFIDGTNKLNYRGMDRLAKIAELLACNTAPIVVERIPENPHLAEARRLAVIKELGASPIPVPPERVIVGAPSAIGLKGYEAKVIYDNLIGQTQSQGRNAATTAAGLSTPGSSGGGGGSAPSSGTPPP